MYMMLMLNVVDILRFVDEWSSAVEFIVSSRKMKFSSDIVWRLDFLWFAHDGIYLSPQHHSSHTGTQQPIHHFVSHLFDWWMKVENRSNHYWLHQRWINRAFIFHLVVCSCIFECHFLFRLFSVSWVNAWYVGLWQFNFWKGF